MFIKRHIKVIHFIFAFFILLFLAGIQSADAGVSELTYSSSFTLRDYGGGIYADDTDDNNGWYGLVTEYPGVMGEHFIEFDISGVGSAPEVKLDFDINNLNSHSTYGTSKDFKIAYYSGRGVIDTSLFGGGTLLTSVTIPTLGVSSFSIDVTGLYNTFVNSGYGFLGISYYDPVWTSSPAIGNQVEFENSTLTVNTTVVPEPISSALFVVGGALFAGRSYLKRKRQKGRR